MNHDSTTWNIEFSEGFVDALLLPLLAYGGVCWIAILGVLI